MFLSLGNFPRLLSMKPFPAFVKRVRADSLSFYFSNFPPSWKRDEMWNAFSTFGQVSDVHLPKRIMNPDSRFGFVRFKRNSVDHSLLEKLNCIWIGSFKIKVSVARNPRDSPTTTLIDSDTQQNLNKDSSIQEVSCDSVDASPIIFKPDPEASQWLMNCLIGIPAPLLDVDSLNNILQDMALVMKQLNRTEEAIEAVKSFRGLCPRNAQESLDNVLIDLCKKCGKVGEQIVLLKHKLKMIYLGAAFNGKPTKTARSHGNKFQVFVKQESSRILGNLGWAYMRKSNFFAAEVVYRKAQMIDADANKALNLCQCLIKQSRYEDAESVLYDVLHGVHPGSDDQKSKTRAEELALELKYKQQVSPLLLPNLQGLNFEDDFVEALERVMNEWGPIRSRTRRLPIFEEISQYRDQLPC